MTFKQFLRAVAMRGGTVKLYRTEDGQLAMDTDVPVVDGISHSKVRGSIDSEYFLDSAVVMASRVLARRGLTEFPQCDVE